MKIPFVLSEVTHSIIDFLFPPACLVCECAYNESDIICTNCHEAVSDCAKNYLPPKCNIENIDEVSILLPYNTVSRKMIHALKYHGIQSIGVVLGKLMAKATLAGFTLEKSPYLVPVPLHPAKRNERGYNQSERIAEGFSSYSGYEIHSGLIRRNKETSTQTALDQKERALNVSGAFDFNGRKSLSGRQILIIDDVLTTGSTVSECAKALKEGGAGKIVVCVVATPTIGNN
ncbi:ComF family protein [Candidatus Latescibacterota bacterium]